MGLVASGKSHPGSVRAENQDRILLDLPLGLFVVCDGMGGHQHGEIAAELAISAVRFYIEASQDRDVSWPYGYKFELSDDANRLGTAVRVANRQVWHEAEKGLDRAGMGTTVAAVLLRGTDAVIGNLGDSRIYLCRELELRQLSIDDTLVASMLSKGLLEPSDAPGHPLRNVLTQAAGSQETVDVHIVEETLQPNDLLLLCSDGLYGCVSEPAIRSILAGEESVEVMVDRLVSAALNARAPDNVSAIVLHFHA
jgi:serine/threonine protein phosphatase PrpC